MPSTTSTTYTPVVTAPPTVTATPLAPFPQTRTGDGDDPYIIPAPREGETVPPVMITQDVSGSRTISTNYIPPVDVPPVPPLPPVTVTAPVTSSDILALSTTPLTIVPAPAAGEALVFQSALATYTYGTTTYTGSGMLQIKCGDTVVSSDVPVTFLTSATGGTATFAALPGVTPVIDMPLTLSMSGGSLIGGDGTLSIDVAHTVQPATPPAGDAPATATASATAPKSTVGTSLYARKNR